jgi:hypothetical protein
VTAIGRLTAVIFPWPSRESRQAAIGAARREKERSVAGAAAAGIVRRQIELMTTEHDRSAAAVAAVVSEGRTQLGVLLAGHPDRRMDCPVLASGRLADCPVFRTGHLTA